jgi:vancomycin resistance protein YoaR
MTRTPAPSVRLREERAGGTRREAGATVLRLLAALLVLGGVYLGAALWFQDRPPAGVSVDGVDVGSMTRADAEAKLAAAFAGRTAEPVRVWLLPQDAVGAEPEEVLLVPTEAGLGLDPVASLDGLTGLSLDPRVLWSHVTGTPRDRPVVATVDRVALEQALTAAAADYDQEPVEGAVAITDEGVQVVDARDGRELDVDRTADAVARAWPASRDVDGTAEPLSPALTTAEVERFTTTVLEPALAAPVLVTATWEEGEDEQSATAELTPRDLVPLLQVDRAADHTLGLVLDEDALLARVRQDLGQLERGPADATVRLDGAEVEVVPARVGAALQTEGLVQDVRLALEAQGEGRTVTATVAAVEPAVGAEVAEGWTFTEMGSFVSAFPTGPGTEARNTNLSAGVRRVDGTVVMPGQQFSLAAALGEVTEEEGYVEAPVLVDGRTVMGLGGGLSQLSTVVFNTSWNSGVQLDAHTPHTFYISRYPAGREATLAIPVVDNLWTNDTDTPVVVRAWIEDDAIHMSYLGERRYQVRTIDGERFDVTEPEEVESDAENCVDQAPVDGFTIITTRVLSEGGSEVRRDQFTTVYQPADEVVCIPADAARR